MKPNLNRMFLLLLMTCMPCPLWANTIYFPQVAFGGGYSTTFAIMNTGATPVASRINFYDQNGVNQTAYSMDIAVPAGGSKRFTLPDSGPLTVVGWGELAAGMATVQGVATFDLRDNKGFLVTTTGVLGIEAQDSFLLPVDVTSTEATGVAIANVKAGSAVTVGLRLLGEDGQQVAVANDARLKPLGSRRQIASFVNELFPQLLGTTFKGTLVVEAAPGAPTNSLAATALTLKEGLLSALPVIPPGYPVFQSDSIRATVNQLFVTPDNSRVQLVVTIENTSSEPVYFVFNYNSEGIFDNRTTVWGYFDSLSGIKRQSYVSSPSDFTTIGPSGQITVLMNFNKQSGGGTPGTTFSFVVQGTYYSGTEYRSSSLKNMSIGFPSIPFGRQLIQAPVSNTPVFQNDSIRVTVKQLTVKSDNSRVQLVVSMENTSPNPMQIAFNYNTEGLIDDRTTGWGYFDSLSGIKRQSYFSSPSDFTTIGPSGQITVLMNFNKQSGGGTPGTTFSFVVQGSYYTGTEFTSSGLKNVSIGFPAIKPVVVSN